MLCLRVLPAQFTATVLLAAKAAISPVLAAAASDLQSVTIEGTRADAISSTATGLALTPRQTPQSLSEISREQMDAFGLDTLNDVLDLATGIDVQRVETDRTCCYARGFAVQSFQVDGIGLPVNWDIVVGDVDTTTYERVEIVRGADGLLTGIGNASATINYVRKRPTRDFRASVELMGGSWSKRRLDADVSGSLKIGPAASRSRDRSQIHTSTGTRTIASCSTACCRVS